MKAAPKAPVTLRKRETLPSTNRKGTELVPKKKDENSLHLSLKRAHHDVITMTDASWLRFLVSDAYSLVGS